MRGIIRHLLLLSMLYFTSVCMGQEQKMVKLSNDVLKDTGAEDG